MLATIEHVIAILGALLVGGTTLVALKNDWHSTGLDNNVTKLMLGLMALGCVLVLLVCFGVIGRHPEAA